jgi:hypothetical protein
MQAQQARRSRLPGDDTDFVVFCFTRPEDAEAFARASVGIG